MDTRVLVRSLLLGCAAGARSSLGPAGPVLTGHHRPAVRGIAALAVVGELVADKLPVAPSRLAHGGALVRAASGAIGAAMLAGRSQAHPALPAVAGAVGGLIGTYGGAAWRAGAPVRDWQAALLEDVVALAAAGLACLPGSLWSDGDRPGTVGALAEVPGPRRRRLSSVGRASHS